MAGEGQEGVEKLPPATGKVETGLKDNRGRTPLLFGGRRGQEGQYMKWDLAGGEPAAGDGQGVGGLERQ